MSDYKVIQIAEDQQIWIKLQDGEIIKDGKIKYRNSGKDFDFKFPNEDPAIIKGNEVLILNNDGMPKIHFSLLLLDANYVLIDKVFKTFGEQLIQIVIQNFGADIVQQYLDQLK